MAFVLAVGLQGQAEPRVLLRAARNYIHRDGPGAGPTTLVYNIGGQTPRRLPLAAPLVRILMRGRGVGVSSTAPPPPGPLPPQGRSWCHVPGLLQASPAGPSRVTGGAPASGLPCPAWLAHRPVGAGGGGGASWRLLLHAFALDWRGCLQQI